MTFSISFFWVLFWVVGVLGLLCLGFLFFAMMVNDADKAYEGCFLLRLLYLILGVFSIVLAITLVVYVLSSPSDTIKPWFGLFEKKVMGLEK